MRPRATHALHHVWLTPSTEQRLDAWQGRVLRRSLCIKAAYYSGVSHDKVRRIAKAAKLSHALRRNHVRYLAHVCREGGPIKSVCFGPGPRFRTLNDKRRVGKPRQKWTCSVFMNAQAALWYYGHNVGNFGRALDRLSSQGEGDRLFWRTVCGAPKEGTYRCQSDRSKQTGASAGVHGKRSR